MAARQDRLSLKDHNVETRAIGLDVSALIGKTRANIESMLGVDIALIGSTEDMLSSWPTDIVVPVFDEASGKHSHAWQLQLRDGTWIHYCSYEVRSQDDLERLPSYIYTRRPRATPQVRIRPIAMVYFNDEGVCSGVTAKIVELQLRDRLQKHRLAGVLEESGPEELCPIDNTLSESPRPSILSLLAFDSPAKLLIVGDVAWAPRPGPPMPWMPSCNLEMLMWLDASLTQRLSVWRPAWDQMLLRVMEENRVGVIRLEPSGCRLCLTDSAKRSHAWMDIYGGELALSVADEMGDSWQAYLVGACWYMPSFGTDAPSLFVLARRTDNTSKRKPALILFDRKKQSIQITAGDGRVKQELRTRHQQAADALFIQVAIDTPQ